MTLFDPVEITRTGDDAPAASLWGYVRRMTGWRQVGLCLLALVAAALNLAPIELQRRIVDDAIVAGDVELLWRLGALYAAAAVAHQAVKFILRAGQSWLGESTILYTRGHLMRLYRTGAAGPDAPAGEAVSIIGAEVEKLGGFVGSAPSTAVTDVAMLLGVVGYMLWVDPAVAGLGIALILPQILITPLMQRRINRLMQRQLAFSRRFGSAVAGLRYGAADEGKTTDGARALYRNRIAIALWKETLKALLNLLNAAGPLSLMLVGGWMAIKGDTTVGVLVAFLSGFHRISDPIRNLITFYRQAQQAGVQHGMIARWM
jgi:ABC-type bacteriocin/lantibiotic exporter with double-glycine peptidase domain